ncbi:hypothetical protein L7F22_061540 [Adiantum nelumboides]|nr:hypothetical protein [Adiantum nelumboides]
MASNGVVMLVVCWLTIMCSNTGVTGDDETWQEVLTTAGTNVVYGASNSYIIWAQDIGIGYVGFYFGLGYTGDAVRTDTAVTLGDNEDESAIFACSDGKLGLVAVNSSGTPENAIIRVRYNSTDSNYRLQITEASPAVYVQFTYLSLGGLLCTSGVAGTPIQFSSASSSSSNHVLHDSTIALRQVVDA